MKKLKRKCFICGCSINEHESYFLRNGNCCVKCSVRCGKVASHKMTKEDADKELLKIRK